MKDLKKKKKKRYETRLSYKNVDCVKTLHVNLPLSQDLR